MVEYHQMTAPLIGYYSKEAEAGNGNAKIQTAPNRLLKSSTIWKKFSANQAAADLRAGLLILLRQYLSQQLVLLSSLFRYNYQQVESIRGGNASD